MRHSRVSPLCALTLRQRPPASRCRRARESRTPHTPRRVLDTLRPHGPTRQERRRDTERLGTVGIITQDIRKIIDSAKLAFVPRV